MAALDFPDAPAVGDLYGSSGTVWRWDGARWASTAGASGARGVVGYAQVTTIQSGITAETVIAGLTATVNCVAGRTYLVTLNMRYRSTVTNDRVLMRLKDGATHIATSDAVMPAVSMAPDPNMFTQGVVTPSTTGPRTFTATLNMVGGSGTASAVGSATAPMFILVEDITYEAGSSGDGYTDTAIACQAISSPVSTATGVWTKRVMASLSINEGGWTIVGGNIVVPKAGLYLISMRVHSDSGQVVVADGGYGSPSGWWMDGQTAGAMSVNGAPRLARLAAGVPFEQWVYNRGAAGSVNTQLELVRLGA